MEQWEVSLDSENQVLKVRPSETKSQGRKPDNGHSNVGEKAKLNGELLVTDDLSENELRAKIVELQSQLDARGDLLAEHETEIAGLKMKMESQTESLKTYVEL